MVEELKYKCIDAARERYQGLERIEIDDNAQISEGEDGYWVSAWVWIDEGSVRNETSSK